VIDRVRSEAAPRLGRLWNDLADHPLVGEARTLGLMGALELTPDKKSRGRFPKEANVGTLCRDICFESGLVMRAVGDTMIVAPPLIISPEQLDELAVSARRCLDSTWHELRKRGLM
jgi:putrescine---pyruvate transaminase